MPGFLLPRHLSDVLHHFLQISAQSCLTPSPSLSTWHSLTPLSCLTFRKSIYSIECIHHYWRFTVYYPPPPVILEASQEKGPTGLFLYSQHLRCFMACAQWSTKASPTHCMSDWELCLGLEGSKKEGTWHILGGNGGSKTASLSKEFLDWDFLHSYVQKGSHFSTHSPKSFAMCEALVQD